MRDIRTAVVFKTRRGHLHHWDFVQSNISKFYREMFCPLWWLTEKELESARGAEGFTGMKEAGIECPLIVWTFEPSERDRAVATKYYPETEQVVILEQV